MIRPAVGWGGRLMEFFFPSARTPADPHVTPQRASTLPTRLLFPAGDPSLGILAPGWVGIPPNGMRIFPNRSTWGLNKAAGGSGQRGKFVWERRAQINSRLPPIGPQIGGSVQWLAVCGTPLDGIAVITPRWRWGSKGQFFVVAFFIIFYCYMVLLF